LSHVHLTLAMVCARCWHRRVVFEIPGTKRGATVYVVDLDGSSLKAID